MKRGFYQAEDNWEVDITTPEKILTVRSDASANEMIATVKEAGFVAEPL